MALDLLIGEQVTVPRAGRKTIILDADGNPFLLSSDGTRAAIGGDAGTITTAAPLSGDGSGGDPATVADGAIAPAKLTVFAAAGFLGAAAAGATAQRTVAQSLATMLPDLYRFRIGNDVDGTGNTTRQVMNEKISAAFCRTLTGNRVLTLGNTDAAVGDLFDIVRTDTSANTLQVNSAAAVNLATFPASPTVVTVLRFYHNGTNWIFNSRLWIQTT